GAGRLVEADDDGDRVVVGSSLEKWLGAMMAREGLLVDREGEWKDVFDGGQLSLEARKKRARVALKADPGAAAWHLEAAERAFEAGRAGECARYAAQAGRVEVWLEEARRLVEEGDVEGALNRATLALAVSETDETRAVVAHVRARAALRVISDGETS